MLVTFAAIRWPPGSWKMTNDRWLSANGGASDSRQVHVVCETLGNKDHVMTQPPSNCWLRCSTLDIMRDKWFETGDYDISEDHPL